MDEQQLLLLLLLHLTSAIIGVGFNTICPGWALVNRNRVERELSSR